MIRTINDLTPEKLVSTRRFISLWNKMKNLYLMSAPASKAARSAYEFQNSMNLEISIVDKDYKGSIKTTCSNEGIRSFKQLTANGKDSTILELKKGLEKIEDFPRTCHIDQCPLLIHSVFKGDVLKRLKIPPK